MIQLEGVHLDLKHPRRFKVKIIQGCAPNLEDGASETYDFHLFSWIDFPIVIRIYNQPWDLL